MSLLRRRRAGSSDPAMEPDQDEKKPEARKPEKRRNKWSCLDNCCWFIGCVCVAWWALLFLYNLMPSSFPQYVTEAITGPLPDPPGVKLKKEGVKAKHPVVFVPGIVTGGLELWEGHQCAEGLFRKRLWGGAFGEVYKRYLKIGFLLSSCFLFGWILCFAQLFRCIVGMLGASFWINGFVFLE